MLSSSIFILSNKANANEKFYYSNQIKEIKISNKDETLLEFPASPLASACQPRGIVDITPAEVNPFTTQDVINAANRNANTPPKENEEDFISKFLKLSPNGKEGSATCTFSLSNNDSFQIKFNLTKNIQRPQIKFLNLYSNAPKAAEISKTLGGINIFRILVVGNNLSYFSDITDNLVSKTWVSNIATYKFEYAGTDRNIYAAWKIRVYPKSKMTNEPLTVKNTGDVYFSAAVNTTNPQKYEFETGEEFTLFILTRSDISEHEITGMLK